MYVPSYMYYHRDDLEIIGQNDDIVTVTHVELTQDDDCDTVSVHNLPYASDDRCDNVSDDDSIRY